jgi:endonuclease-8
LIHFDDGRALRTHMRMTGSWHLYRPGERWQRSPKALRALIEVPGWVAVCFSAPEVELVADGGAAATAHLGPDLTLAAADIDEAVRRMGTMAADATIGEALLDQRVAAGLGNVYKSEACFACGIDPFTPVAELDDERRHRVVTTAADQLRANLDTAHRVTWEGRALAVYGRRDRPCRRCGTPIRWAPQGAQRRGTYWCPVCQPR